MVKDGFKSLTIKEELWDWLNAYKKLKRLKSIPQAIEWVITEAGYDPSKSVEGVQD